MESPSNLILMESYYLKFGMTIWWIILLPCILFLFALQVEHYFLYREMLSSIWDEIGIAEDKAQLVDISNWPMACVDSRYKVRLGQDLLIRGFGEEYHQGISRVGPEVFRYKTPVKE